MTPYQHHWIDGTPIDLPVGKAVCVGRNYADHAKELGNDVPDTPVLFIKPATALCHFDNHIVIPQGQGEVHHEIELAILIGEEFSKGDAAEAHYHIAGFGLALDLTLRDLQNALKAKGLPWERAKAFDGSCPTAGFVDARGISTRQAIELSLAVNGEVRQKGRTDQMLFSMHKLLAHISQTFTLLPGDIVLTGTPSGVAALNPGDQLVAKMGNVLTVNGAIAS